MLGPSYEAVNAYSPPPASHSIFLCLSYVTVEPGSGRGSLPACPYSQIPLYAGRSVATPVLWNNLDDCIYRDGHVLRQGCLEPRQCPMITRALSTFPLEWKIRCRSKR